MRPWHRLASVMALSCSLLLSSPLPLSSQPAQAAGITDMAGRTVTVPEPARRVYVMSHSLAIMTALAPDLLVGLPFPFRRNPDAEAYLPPRFASLPQLDGNLEQLKALQADFAVGWTTPAFVRDQVPRLERIGLPSLLVDVDRLDRYPATFRFLGAVLQRQERGEALATALEEALKRMETLVQTVPASRRLRVYYAESVDGLTTQCDSSARSDVLERAGAINAMHCSNPLTSADNMPTDLETVVLVNPDVIITRYPQTAGQLKADPRWQRLKAVRDGRVYAIPSLPFSWFDRPPSFMRALGMQWLAQTLYPDLVKIDLAEETRRFYRLFFAVSLSEADLDKILGRPQ